MRLSWIWTSGSFSILERKTAWIYTQIFLILFCYNVHNSGNTRYPVTFSQLLFHRIQSYRIFIGYYCGMEMCQAIGSCCLNGFERSVNVFYLRPTITRLIDVLFCSFLLTSMEKECENTLYLGSKKNCVCVCVCRQFYIHIHILYICVYSRKHAT